LQPCSWKAGLSRAAFDQRVAQRFDFRGDRFEEGRARGAGARAVDLERLRCGGHRLIRFRGGGRMEIGLDRFVARGIDRAEGFVSAVCESSGEEVLPSEWRHVRLRN